MALVRNKRGEFVAPTPASVSAAAAGTAEKLGTTTDYRISIVDADGAGAYPISSFTWILLYRHQTVPSKAKYLLDFLRWALSDGQPIAEQMQYGPLPDVMRQRLIQRLDSVKVSPVACLNILQK